MSSWSLPPIISPNRPPDLRVLFDEWSTAKAWTWIRSGAVSLADPDVLNHMACRTLEDMGAYTANLSSAWHVRSLNLQNPWEVPLVRLPSCSQEPWPAQAQVLAETPIGLLAALVANGWDPFAPFISIDDGNAPDAGERLRPQWGVEVVLGLIGTTRLTETWRLSLVDQMLRSPCCPALEVLQQRTVGQTKKSDPVDWWHAGFRYRNPLVTRICLERGIHGDLWTDWPEMEDREHAWWQTLILEHQVETSHSPVARSPRL